MNKKQWVQYKNDPNGTKWEVVHIAIGYYAVNGDEDIGFLYFPKGEYVLCDPPERWVDVTAECTIVPGGDILHNNMVSVFQNGYRWRKVQLYLAKPDSEQNCTQWAFIVEKRED